MNSNQTPQERLEATDRVLWFITNAAAATPGFAFDVAPFSAEDAEAFMEEYAEIVEMALAYKNA